ncbi:1-acyl-sn-glycerol-3-phosphate acyltransferase [Yoonia sediminilitoris]|uniref:Acyltransferase-like protein n=1 Tax=Yoonia sediminilitoris TaxID=1286148 RepID=A0A2T6KQM3_9RHOB|nr:1-acyl-sn-glycerol-3-phosphate acyltransferase [Yoonia sediminilitoris]PUB18863.1 acyltransferase-like protein [Yoonia sediminilitoris]RCW99031.1 acyltransferase-like protein [Yoonia sediminilitoris]
MEPLRRALLYKVMEHRIDPLIAERAPWLYRDGRGSGLARAMLHRLLAYDKTVRIAQSFEHSSADEIMCDMGNRLARTVTAKGLGHIPAHGPALIVANHPTGIADGIILHHLIARQRADAYFFANRDILRVLPQMGSMIAPVEWRTDKRSHAKTRETMAYVRRATHAGRLGVIFPSGRLAKRRGLRLHERPWMGSAAMLARKFDLPVVPVNIQARNSALFYLFDRIHPTLRDITLFHETLNKAKQPFRITVGDPISAAAIPHNPADGIALLRRATLALGGKDAPTVSLVSASRFAMKG